jgi:sugar O-acyltransferase (sialic acid O-acetyltransferase NeuD family)
MRQPLIFWGGRGHARVLAEALDPGSVCLEAIFDRAHIQSPIAGVPLHPGADFERWLTEQDGRRFLFAIAIGGGGRHRIDVASRFLKAGLDALQIVHRSAYVARDAVLGAGCQVLAGAVIASHAQIGDYALVNTRASVDHDTRIGTGVHVGPGAVLCGEIVVEDAAFIGAGATILPRLKIGEQATVGAGAVVTHDVAPGATVVGNPAREILR